MNDSLKQDIARIINIDATPLVERGEELSAAYARIDELEAALRFYADHKRYNGANQRNEISDPFSAGPYLQDVTRDGGDIARKALHALEPFPGNGAYSA
jgi:hypothetical protein